MGLEILPEERVEEAARLAAAAFIDSPVYRYIYGDDSDVQGREEFLAFVFSRNFRLRLGTSCCKCTMDAAGKEVVSFFMWVPPDVRHPNMWDMLRVGMGMMPWLFGLDRFRRLLAVKDWFEKAEEEALGGRKMIRLERMTVLPSYQGKGIGSAALKEALVEADRRQLPVFLATQEERNVTFYTRLGFSILQKRTFEPADCTNWFMIREPSSDRSSDGEDS